MGVVTSLILVAVGAVLRFATNVQTSSFNVHAIGVILMIVGVIGFILSLMFWASWGGFGTIRRSSHRRAAIYQQADGSIVREVQQRAY